MTSQRLSAGDVDLFDGRYDAFLFDMDGVLTDTAKTHSEAWKEAFDAFLQKWSREHDVPFVEFDRSEDYDTYVDGKRREDGVRDFLLSRNIDLPMGSPDDPATAETVWGVATSKNVLVLDLLDKRGVDVYDGSVEFVHQAKAAGIKVAVVSSSANTTAVLDAGNIRSLFDEQMDGKLAAELGLPGKPKPDTYVRAAENLGVSLEKAVVFEDALAGVGAGQAGGFGLVVGVDRVGQTDALYANGADVVVKDLKELCK